MKNSAVPERKATEEQEQEQEQEQEDKEEKELTEIITENGYSIPIFETSQNCNTYIDK